MIAYWCAGLRIREALALAETDSTRPRGAVRVRAGKGGRRREGGMDRLGVGAARPLARAQEKTSPQSTAALCFLSVV